MDPLTGMSLVSGNIDNTLKSKRSDIGAGYDTLGDNLSSVRSVGNEPYPLP